MILGSDWRLPRTCTMDSVYSADELPAAVSAACCCANVSELPCSCAHAAIISEIWQYNTLGPTHRAHKSQIERQLLIAAVVLKLTSLRVLWCCKSRQLTRLKLLNSAHQPAFAHLRHCGRR